MLVASQLQCISKGFEYVLRFRTALFCCSFVNYKPDK